MTTRPSECERAVEELDECLSVWSRWSMEAFPESREPEEIAALGRARDALEVLRCAHVKPREKAGARVSHPPKPDPRLVYFPRAGNIGCRFYESSWPDLGFRLTVDRSKP